MYVLTLECAPVCNTIIYASVPVPQRPSALAPRGTRQSKRGKKSVRETERSRRGRVTHTLLRSNTLNF